VTTRYGKIDKDMLPQMIGKSVHLGWAMDGCVWVLESIKGDKVELRTPKTRKKFTSNTNDVYWTKKNKKAQRIKEVE